MKDYKILIKFSGGKNEYITRDELIKRWKDKGEDEDWVINIIYLLTSRGEVNVRGNTYVKL